MLISDIPNLFKQGKTLANPATWANGTALTGALTGFLLAVFHLAKLVGYDFGVNDATLTQAAGGIASVVLVGASVLHTFSNPNAGLQADGAPGPVTEPVAPGAEVGGAG